MKVLIVNTSDINGGAARAAYRLHRSLLEAGIDSQMLVQAKSSDDFTVLGPVSKIEKGLNKLRPELDGLAVKRYKNKTQTLFSPASFGFSSIVDKINQMIPDIVHLHWVCDGMLSVEAISKIKAPIVWSLHDMWALTGGCHYDEECGAYRAQCGQCKVLRSDKEKDLSRQVFLRKQQAFTKIKQLTIIGLSQWLADCAKESALFNQRQVECLPNPINTQTFKPFETKKARQLWGLPSNKKLVLFGAMAATSDLRKGFKELTEAMTYLKGDNIEFVVFGSSQPENSQDFGFKTHYLGHLHDDVSLVTLYSAVDVMVVPSLQENLSNAIMESLACATPVVGFNIGGNSDLIEHKKNGYLAQTFDTQDLANGIEWVLVHPKYSELSNAAREKILEKFDSRLVAKQYIELYDGGI